MQKELVRKRRKSIRRGIEYAPREDFFLTRVYPGGFVRIMQVRFSESKSKEFGIQPYFLGKRREYGIIGFCYKKDKWYSKREREELESKVPKALEYIEEKYRNYLKHKEDEITTSQEMRGVQETF